METGNGSRDDRSNELMNSMFGDDDVVLPPATPQPTPTSTSTPLTSNVEDIFGDTAAILPPPIIHDVQENNNNPMLRAAELRQRHNSINRLGSEDEVNQLLNDMEENEASNDFLPPTRPPQRDEDEQHQPSLDQSPPPFLNDHTPTPEPREDVPPQQPEQFTDDPDYVDQDQYSEIIMSMSAESTSQMVSEIAEISLAEARLMVGAMSNTMRIKLSKVIAVYNRHLGNMVNRTSLAENLAIVGCDILEAVEREFGDVLNIQNLQIRKVLTKIKARHANRDNQNKHHVWMKISNMSVQMLDQQASANYDDVGSRNDNSSIILQSLMAGASDLCVAGVSWFSKLNKNKKHLEVVPSTSEEELVPIEQPVPIPQSSTQTLESPPRQTLPTTHKNNSAAVAPTKSVSGQKRKLENGFIPPKKTVKFNPDVKFKE